MRRGGVKVASLQRVGKKVLYRGRLFALNRPTRSSAKGKKKMVLATKMVGGERRAKLIHFGAKGYGHNYSPQAKKSYLARSAGIRTRSGRLTKDDRWSANYWARKVLWPTRRPARGPRST
jgi:hypothetical protein